MSPAGDDALQAVDIEVACAKIRSSKRILLVMAVAFGSAALSVSAESGWRTVLGTIAVISMEHLVFHVWCDSEDAATMASRHARHVYLVMASNAVIMWICADYNNVFVKGLTILVMPMAFIRETESKMLQATFLSLHFVMAVYTFRADLLGSGIQWLANLAIVDAMAIDVADLRRKALELGKLLQSAYDLSQRMSQSMIEHLLSSLCDGFVVVDEAMTILAPSPTLAGMLSRYVVNDGTLFTDYVRLQDRNAIKDENPFGQSIAGGAVEASDACHLSSLRVALLDIRSSPVEVILFFAKIWGPDGDYIHYIGICRATGAAKEGTPSLRRRSRDAAKLHRRRTLSPRRATDLNSLPQAGPAQAVKFLQPVESPAVPMGGPGARRRQDSPTPAPGSNSGPAEQAGGPPRAPDGCRERSAPGTGDAGFD